MALISEWRPRDAPGRPRAAVTPADCLDLTAGTRRAGCVNLHGRGDSDMPKSGFLWIALAKSFCAFFPLYRTVTTVISIAIKCWYKR